MDAQAIKDFDRALDASISKRAAALAASLEQRQTRVLFVAAAVADSRHLKMALSLELARQKMTQLYSVALMLVYESMGVRDAKERADPLPLDISFDFGPDFASRDWLNEIAIRQIERYVDGVREAAEARRPSRLNGQFSV